MNTEANSNGELPEALVDERRRFSLVWLIPLVAVLAAAWLGWRAYAEQGPLVTIVFETAEGLEAGKTRVRFKDVDVGVVEAIELSPDLGRVNVRARLASQVEAFVNDKTRFWVVRPRLSGGQVSGLGTLVGGTYIAVDLTREGVSMRRFEGLETPPIVTASEAGRSFSLSAERLGSLSVGSPVHYRGIEVGRVTSYALREPAGVDIQVFIQAPYDQRVAANTRFWNDAGFQLSLDAEGLRIDTGSLAAMLLGGIAFGLPPGDAPGDAIGNGDVFALFASEQAAFASRPLKRDEWQLAFQGSVRGLVPGAPVEFRGIRIGEVADVRLAIDPKTGEVGIPVVIAIDSAQLGIADAGQAGGRAFWDGLVGRGLRAQLKTGNLLTGALFVDLDFYPDEPVQRISWEGERPLLPTVATPLDELRGLLSRLARLPLDRMGEDLGNSLAALSETMNATNALLRRLDRETASELSRTLAQTRKTLASAEKVLAPNSPLQSEAYRALRELAEAARSFRIMADYLERHPEALIRGKGADSP
jgi:paraquat-inducible protein B